MTGGLRNRRQFEIEWYIRTIVEITIIRLFFVFELSEIDYYCRWLLLKNHTLVRFRFRKKIIHNNRIAMVSTSSGSPRIIIVYRPKVGIIVFFSVLYYCMHTYIIYARCSFLPSSFV